MSSSSGLKSEHEGHLLQISKDFDGALSSRSTEKLDSILDDNVIVHKDGISLGNDVTGKSAVKEWIQSYIDKYEFTHDVICGAVDEQAQVTFSFWQDKDVKPVSGKFPEDLPEAAKKPSHTVGIWHLQLDSAGKKVQHVYFLRQLSADETHRKLKEDPGQEIKFNPDVFKGSDKVASKEAAQENDKLASTYNNIWKTGNPSAADDILADDMHQYQPVLGQELVGKDKFKELIEKFASNWETTSQKSHVAVSAGDKAFIWWHSSGKEKKSGKEDTVYGLNLLHIVAGKIQTVVGFRQLVGEESEKLVASSVQR